MSRSIQNDNYLVINFLCFRFPVGNFWKINLNQKTSWDCNLCSTNSIYMKQKRNVNLNLPLPLWLKISLIDDKISFPLFPNFCYSSWLPILKDACDNQNTNVCAKSLFIVFWNVRMILTKWVIILEFGKNLF